MTTTATVANPTLILTAPCPAVVLRRAALGEKDRAILRCIWQRWAAHQPPPSYREMVKEVGYYTTSAVEARLGGSFGRKRRGLIHDGWISGGGYDYARTLVPGPRFKGLGSDGWPLELVEVEL